MNYDYNSKQSSSTSDPLFGLVVKIVAGLLIILGVPILLIGPVGSRQIQQRFPAHQRLAWGLVLVLALVCIYSGYHFFWPITRPGSPFMILLADFARGLHNGGKWDYWRLFHEILPVWGMELLLAPAAVIVSGVIEAARQKTPEQLEQLSKQQQLTSMRQALKAAERRLKGKNIPVAVTVRGESHPFIVLGAPVEGGLPEWLKQGWFCLPFEFLILHAVVIGVSGSGKSETLLRIAIAAAKALGWQVILIDLKGDYKAMAKFVIAMEEAGITNVRLFPCESYNGWVGTRDALLSRLLAIDNIGEVTSAGQHHYQTVRENLVEMAVNAPGGPPRGSQEFLTRLMLTNGVLFDLYEGYHEQQSYLESILKREEDAISAYGHYRSFFSKVHGKLDGTWSFEDCDAAYVLLDGLALPEVTDGVGRFLLADFVNYTTRKPWNKRVMFMFDEAGALNVPLYNIFERVRFRQVSVVVSSQDPSGLASKPGGASVWNEVRRILGNSAIKIVHRSEDASEVIRRAGTERVPEKEYRTDASGLVTKAGTTRYRDELKIDANDVLRLKVGNVFTIGPGDYQRVQVAMHKVDQASWELLVEELERQAKEEPPPMPRRGRGGPGVVDSTLASGSRNGSTSGAPKPGTSSSNKKNGKPSAAGKQQNGGLPSPSASPGGQKPPGQNAPPAPPKAEKQPGQTATSPARAVGKAPDIDETLPFALPEIDPNTKTNSGVLPMWDGKDEDLLP